MLALRRGLGGLFLLAGAAHAGLMGWAMLCSLGLLRSAMTARLWSQLTFGHFLGLVLGCAVYLALGYRRLGEFHFEPLLDFLAGVAAFNVVLTASVFLLATRRLPAPFALLPSAFLLAYGLGLIKGRRFGFWKGAPPREGSGQA